MYKRYWQYTWLEYTMPVTRIDRVYNQPRISPLKKLVIVTL